MSELNTTGTSDTRESATISFGRLRFVLSSVLLMLLGFLMLIPLDGLLLQAMAVLLSAVSLAFFVLRIRDAGYSGWLVALGLLPFFGVLVLVFCLVAPTGYRTGRRLDAPGLVILSLFLFGVLFLVYAGTLAP